MKDRAEALIDLLFDNNASIAERDDAAIYLREFPENRIITALILKSKDLNEDEIVLNSCGESLGVIWVRQNFFDDDSYRTLPGIVRYGVYIVIESRKPEWVKKYKLNEDDFK